MPSSKTQHSFRRILVARLLLLSLPVLLVGAVTYRKARSGLLETARQNLTESASRMGMQLYGTITFLRSDIFAASNTTIIRSGSAADRQAFLESWLQRLPVGPRCAQLETAAEGTVLASACAFPLDVPTLPKPDENTNNWVLPARAESLADAQVYSATELDLADGRILDSGELLGPLPASWQQATAPAESSATLDPQVGLPVDRPWRARPRGLEGGNLDLALRSPVYDDAGELQAVLTLRAGIPLNKDDRAASLTGYTTIFDADGRILAHPDGSYLGQNIDDQGDRGRLQSILRNAIAGRRNFLHLFFFDRDGEESLAGYTAIPDPSAAEGDRQLVLLAVTRLDNALHGLFEIQQILIALVLGMLAVNLVGILYLARDLSSPIEQLQAYAEKVQAGHASEDPPPRLRIWEFHHLAQTLHHMVQRLTDWAHKLEEAWREARLANQLKNEFLATTSHELRTPLNGIIGMLAIVKDGLCDDREEEMDCIENAHESAVHLLGIIDDILDIANIESGTLAASPEPMDLRPVVDGVLDEYAPAIAQKGLTLQRPHWTGPVVVRADPEKLAQVLRHLLSNAVKFTESGEIALRTSDTGPSHGAAAQSGRHRGPTILKVIDTGIGIEPEQQSKLFQPFVMADGTLTRAHGGAGLGLAISKHLIELMDGTIELSSPGRGGGTTVTLTLPRMDPSLLQRAEASPAPAKPPAGDGGSDRATEAGNAVVPPERSPAAGSTANASVPSASASGSAPNALSADPPTARP